MKFNMRTLIMAAVAPALLAACDNADLAKRTQFPNDASHTYISSTTGSQMVAEASGRQRIRNLRAEVTGNIAYLRSHLGEERSHILDMQDSLLVTIPGRAAFKGEGDARLTDSGIDAIARVAASMIEFPHTRITIAGHVKGTDSDQRDQVLSERRAVAVKSVLMSHGIDVCRIGVLGKGSDDHVAAPVSERRNQYNDRIEVLMKPYQDGACV